MYLRFNAVAVCDGAAIQSWSCGKECAATLSSFDNGSQILIGPTGEYNVHGYVTRLNAASCLVVIAGTSFYNWRNIRADLEFWLTSWPSGGAGSTSARCPAAWCRGCKVMKGFAAAYEEIRPEIFAAVRQLACPSLVFSGHSLGGAIATQAALEALLKPGCSCPCHFVAAEQCIESHAGLWTYGMPRVGNEAFANVFVATARALQQLPPMWRVARDFDLIPQVPPRWLGYCHIPWAVRYLKGDSEWIICREELEDPECTYPGGTMADHHNYFGITGTDENAASIECVSLLSLQRKHEQRQS
ncbi:unnamed protein product, partial [Symbiodinium necroappetens]